MDEIVHAIDAILSKVQANTIGEFVRADDVDDWLLDLRSLACQEPVSV